MSGTLIPVRLLIVSHVIHYRWQGRLWAYGPYVREIELWANIFPEITIACPLREEPAPADCLPFEHTNIHIRPVAQRGGNSIAAKIWQMLSLPAMVLPIARAMRAADAIFVRCPGNLGLLGVMLAPLFSRYRVAKYAGQWGGYPGEAITYRWQRRLLQSRWWNAPVLVYGDWPNQPPHIVPFFTSLIDARLLREAKAAAAEKTLHQPLRVLFVGRLSRSKNVHVLIRALGDMRKGGLVAECNIIGEGPEQDVLHELSASERLEDRVHFAGALEYEQVMPYYAWADVLVLASETEGWPKAIAEAMTFGVVCIGSNRGFVPQMVTPERGVCVPPGDVRALAEALRAVQSDPQRYLAMSQASAGWAQQYTMEAFQQAIYNLLQDRWQIDLDQPLLGVGVMRESR